ncbi:oligoendopeptidase, PepF/M3 family [Candidatus Magnetoovum chiemensis]|nr:oligoendopeptidase, PepF/M3 family [Candidatus Magnetoovum chiemensis]
MSNQNNENKGILLMAYSQTKWSLDELIKFDNSTNAPNASDVNGILIEIEEIVKDIETYRDKLDQELTSSEFTSLVRKVEKLYERSSIISSYGPLWFSEDTQNQSSLAFMSRIDETLTKAYNRVLFFSLWWKALDNDKAKQFLDAAGELKYYLTQIRLFKDHTLSEPEEKIINIKDINGINALNTLYDMITSKYVFELEAEGEKMQLTRDALTDYVRHPSADIREAAYKELYRVYSKDEAALGQIYIFRLKDYKNEQLDLRGFKEPIAVRNLSNDLDGEVVDILLNVCKEQSHVFHKYFKLKAERLGLPVLRRYDLYAPIKTKSDKKIAYEDAVNMVLRCFNEFSPEFAKQAKRIFDDRHVDGEIRHGKRGGAFCYSVLPKLAPWVLVNYTGQMRQVATIAHELGHGVHSLLASERSVLNFHSALPMAETASVFSEMLLFDALLEQEKDPEIRLELISSALDDAYATIIRQVFFVLFEKQAHSLISQNKTIGDLNSAYLNLLKEQFGSSVDVSEEFFAKEWITIPHIYHTPFYCYAYAFGHLLSLSIYRQYKERGKDFAPVMLKILSYGGSQSPEIILKEAGFNIREPKFWQSGFKTIDDMIDRLQAMYSAGCSVI